MPLDCSQIKVRSFNQRLYNWFSRNGRSFPWRRNPDLYSLLIAEILLQKTNADRVVSAYEEILREYPTPKDMASAATIDIKNIIRHLGISSRSENLKGMARHLLTLKTTPSEQELLQIRGVGTYIARSVLIHTKQKKLSLLDPNFIRTYSRVFGLTSSRSRPRTDPELWLAAVRLVPRRNPSRYVYAILDFGALICRASSPKCLDCPMYQNVCSGVDT